MAAADVGVVHLVWAPLGLAPLERFLTSWRAHDPGTEHELVAVLNGFDDDAGPARERLAEAGARVLETPEPMQDLAAYLLAAGRLEHRRLCFVNSYSEILADGWLELLCRADAGLAGATGTWESHLRGDPGDPPVSLRALRRAAAVAKLAPRFGRFPNPHVRTNAFVVARELLLGLDTGSLTDKTGAAAFEGGRRSLTRQVQARGRSVVVVGRDGRSYAPEEWRDSLTFRREEQPNLLVADNRTRQYAEASPQRRRQLEWMAWGQPG